MFATKIRHFFFTLFACPPKGVDAIENVTKVNAISNVVIRLLEENPDSSEVELIYQISTSIFDNRDMSSQLDNQVDISIILPESKVEELKAVRELIQERLDAFFGEKFIGSVLEPLNEEQPEMKHLRFYSGEVLGGKRADLFTLDQAIALTDHMQKSLVTDSTKNWLTQIPGLNKTPE